MALSEDSGVTFATVVITPNNYSGTTLAAELALQLTTNSPNGDTYSASYDNNSKKLTINNPTRTWQLGNVDKNPHAELGISASQLGIDTVNDGSNWSLTSAVPINISGTTYVDVITNLSAHSHSVGANRQVLVRVPITVPFGNIIFYEPSKGEEQFVSHAQLNEIWLELRDDKNNLFKLGEYSHVSMNLGIRQLLNDKVPDLSTAKRMQFERHNGSQQFVHAITRDPNIVLGDDDTGLPPKFFKF
jgi:hypothetical protein